MDAATAAVLMALINTAGTVLVLWIRAQYSYHSTVVNGGGLPTPHPPKRKPAQPNQQSEVRLSDPPTEVTP